MSRQIVVTHDVLNVLYTMGLTPAIPFVWAGTFTIDVDATVADAVSLYRDSGYYAGMTLREFLEKTLNL